MVMIPHLLSAQGPGGQSRTPDQAILPLISITLISGALQLVYVMID